MYAPDVISFARKIGVYSGADEDFSFSDVYDPVTFSGARWCEARVWSFFGSVMGEDWAAQYLDYAQGYNLTNRMPLWVMPPKDKKIGLADTFQFMRSHYEGTPLDMTGQEFSDVGASYGGLPIRFRPLTWGSAADSHDGKHSNKPTDQKQYFNERAISTQQTGWNFVAQTRAWMPRELSALLWFGVDDSATTAHFPIYGGATEVPAAYAGASTADGLTPPVMKFDMQRANTVFNLVANWAYSRWNTIYPEVYDRILRTESKFIEMAHDMDETATAKYNSEGAAAAVAYATQRCVDTGNELVKHWAEFFGELFVKFRDGYTIEKDPENTACGCKVVDTPYPQTWYDRIVTDTGKHYEIPTEPSSTEAKLSARAPGLRPIDKAALLNKY